MNDGLTTLRRLCPGSVRNSRAVAALLACSVLALVASAAEVPCGGLTFSETFDGVQSPNLPAGWTASQGANSGDPLWITSPTTPYTAPNAAFTAVPDHVLDNRLDSPGFFSSAGPGTLYFRHKFDFQNGLDGAVLEVSAPNLNGGQFTEFTAATGYFVAGGYNGTITSPSNPLAGRSAWTGNSNGYFRTEAGVSTDHAQLRITHKSPVPNGVRRKRFERRLVGRPHRRSIFRVQYARSDAVADSAFLLSTLVKRSCCSHSCAAFGRRFLPRERALLCHGRKEQRCGWE